MSKCRGCGFEHGLDTCTVAKAKREVRERDCAAMLTAGFVVNSDPMQLTEAIEEIQQLTVPREEALNAVNAAVNVEPSAVNKRRGAYPNTEARREYMRQKMRERREAEKARG